MRDEYWHAFFWVFVVASWAFGFAYGRWAGGGGFFSELGKAVSVPDPSGFSSWWQPLAYFTLTILAMSCSHSSSSALGPRYSSSPVE
jgi:hypothetical protein